jgi:hypothetical protein
MKMHISFDLSTLMLMLLLESDATMENKIGFIHITKSGCGKLPVHADLSHANIFAQRDGN